MKGKEKKGTKYKDPLFLNLMLNLMSLEGLTDTVPKSVLLKLFENTPEFICPNCLPIPKCLGF